MPDVSNERLLKSEMAKALDVPARDLEISESPLEGFGAGDARTVRIKGGVRGTEWTVVGGDDDAEAIAKAVVRQDIESEPENFNQDFIQGHVDVDRLRDDLRSDVQSMIYDDLKEEAERNPIEFLKANDIDIPEPTERQLREYAETMADEDKGADAILAELRDMGDAEDRWIAMGDEPEVPDREIEAAADAEAERRLRDPMDYLRDIYGDGAPAKAIEIAGIDVESAVDEAVRVDGWQHFLARYDGESHETTKGFVWWREN